MSRAGSLVFTFVFMEADGSLAGFPLPKLLCARCCRAVCLGDSLRDCRGLPILDPQEAAPSRQMLLLQFKPNLGINCFDQQDLASQPHRPSCRIGMHRRRPRQSATTLRQEKCGSLILRIAHFLLLATNAVSIELRGDYFHSYIPLRELP